MDRNRRQQAGKSEHFTKMIRATMEEPAWKALPPVAQALYPWLKLEWRGPKANNNGRISLSVRQAADALGVTPDTAARAFHELQAKGFLVQTSAAKLGIEGEAKSSTYELTELSMPGKNAEHGRKLYRDWRPNNDFPVQRAAANNPRGRNGKRKAPDLQIVTDQSKPA
jgi:DNA-binding transcriptional MocR family regulator